MPNGWRSEHYAALRIVLGAYLLVHFAHLTPWAAEVLSNRGALPTATSSPLLRLFPNALGVFDSPAFATLFVASGALGAVGLIAGRGDRLAALWLWYVLACVFGRNPLTSNPSLPYVGWMLLMHVLVGPSRAARRTGEWRMPPLIYGCAWALLAIGYGYSGLTKLSSPSWLDGSALEHILHNPLARPTAVRTALLEAPEALLRGLTWSALALELAFAPLATIARLRPAVWLAGVVMQLSLLVLLDFADLTLGMLLVHALTLDPGWLPRATPVTGKSQKAEAEFRGSLCSHCWP